MRRVLIVIIILSLLYISAFFIANNMKDVSISNKIAVIPIYGMITIGNHESILQQPEASSNKIISFLEAAEKDNSVKAILLEINSPGGTVVASYEIADKVKSINKPVVALIREVGASGAYWVASAADRIVANPMSITGSIGVLASYLEFSGLMEKYGVKYEGLTAGEYKDIGSPYKTLTDREKFLLQNKINLIQNEFIKEVSKNRNRDLGKFATGLYYLGAEAKDMGLIDFLGDKKLAIDIAKKLANIKDAELVYYKESENILNVLNKFTSELGLNIGKGISSSLLESQNKIVA